MTDNYDELLEMKEVTGVFGMYQGGATFETKDDKLEGYVYVPESPDKLSDYIRLKEKSTDREIDFVETELEDDDGLGSAEIMSEYDDDGGA